MRNSKHTFTSVQAVGRAHPTCAHADVTSVCILTNRAAGNVAQVAPSMGSGSITLVDICNAKTVHLAVYVLLCEMCIIRSCMYVFASQIIIIY